MGNINEKRSKNGEKGCVRSKFVQYFLWSFVGGEIFNLRSGSEGRNKVVRPIYSQRPLV